MFLRYCIIGLLALVGSAWAEDNVGPRMRLKGGPGMGPGGRLGIGLKKGPPPPSPAMLERWRGMSADERQQMVDRLPPERRDVFRRRMELWANMKPEERKGVADRFAGGSETQNRFEGSV